MPSGPGPRAVAFSNASVHLAGALTVPAGGTACPGVVMVGGSGPADRTNDGYFSLIGRHFADAGCAVLSYDKRGVGASSGDWRDATLDDLAADAGAALDFLRARPGVRAEAVGLFGHSEGGWVVLRAAATARDRLPWVITNSCPGMTPQAQDRFALANTLRRRHFAQQDVDDSLALFDRLAEAGRRDADFGEATRLVASAGAAVSLADYWAGVDERLWEFLKRKQDHDPVPDALRLRCPHLAVYGGADPLVPVAESVRLFTAAACHPGRAPRAPLTVEVFPGADHRIRTDGGTRPAPGHLGVLTRWVTCR
ncbi:alpha/beta hydrolase [Streptomyces sp. SID14478]|uniref:alpha/beta hydrolase family protein n=1 Tax=Streptomyces sp. SID14478 TaxID=2706073 RepID=UPI0013DB060B|nr:alpha/beta hydrolase [Streptomyces sp. SID14478]NEB78246.1 alpha/beta hydrolase [Streptomyces sp. SID14478]